MQIRLMTLNDYDAAIFLWKSTAGIGISDRDDSRDRIARYLARNPSTCFVAEENGRLIGTVLAGHDGRRGFIYHAAVAHFARG
ncbi:MAG TPA: GNAT family N-acetyltransferase, partial [Candidatus Limiplasma sp.]|nr:GNAT family N-acetyltransferase [Candidatus Limiplasma sp.]